MTLQQIEERIEVLRGRIYNIQQKHGNIMTCTRPKALRLQFVLMADILKLTQPALRFSTPQPKYPEGTL